MGSCRRLSVLVAGLGMVAVACGGAADVPALGELPILSAPWPGTGPPVREVDDADHVVELRRVEGDFEVVSAELVRLVRAQGWTVTSVRCVGTGNDVIAVREIALGAWAKLQSGAGTAGAGMILTPTDPVAPLPLAPTVQGQCSATFLTAVG